VTGSLIDAALVGLSSDTQDIAERTQRWLQEAIDEREFTTDRPPHSADWHQQSCWSTTNADGVSVTYRSASTASSDTAATTASVDINFKPDGNAINGGKPLKLKFPQHGGR